jgi:hypothetical protein
MRKHLPADVFLVGFRQLLHHRHGLFQWFRHTKEYITGPVFLPPATCTLQESVIKCGRAWVGNPAHPL